MSKKGTKKFVALDSADEDSDSDSDYTQELETIFPNDVTDLPDGTKNVKIENTQWALIKAVQELSAKNDALETEIAAIKTRLDALED